MSRTALVVALLSCAVPSTAGTFSVDLVPGGPIVAVSDALASYGRSSLFLPLSGNEDARYGDPLGFATSCQLAGCAEGVEYEDELAPEAAPEAATSCDLTAAEPGCELTSRLR